MRYDVLYVVAERFTSLGLNKPVEEVRFNLGTIERQLTRIMDHFARFGCPNDIDVMPQFVIDSVGRAEDHFVAKLSIDGNAPAAVIRYWPD